MWIAAACAINSTPLQCAHANTGASASSTNCMQVAAARLSVRMSHGVVASGLQVAPMAVLMDI